MASVSITNQTLTMTITIDGVDTVIRKDNCKVQAFGDVVRITDYKGSIYEFLYSDCTAPDEPTANDLRDAIEDFLNTGGGGGGGGITTLTSTDGSIDIDLTDQSAPDLSTGFIRSVFTGTLEQNSGVISQQINNIGGVISIEYDINWGFRIERTGGTPLTGITIINFNSGLIDSTTGIPVSLSYTSTILSIGDGVQGYSFDGTSLPSDGVVNFSFTLDYYPNGWDA